MRREPEDENMFLTKIQADIKVSFKFALKLYTKLYLSVLDTLQAIIAFHRAIQEHFLIIRSHSSKVVILFSIDPSHLNVQFNFK